jgi:hypothetical protein
MWWNREKRYGGGGFFLKLTFPTDNGHYNSLEPDRRRQTYWVSVTCKDPRIPNKHGWLRANGPDYLPALSPGRRNYSVRILDMMPGNRKKEGSLSVTWNPQTQLRMQEDAAISSHGYSLTRLLMVSLIYGREAATSTRCTYQSLCFGTSIEETDTGLHWQTCIQPPYEFHEMKAVRDGPCSVYLRASTAFTI